MCVHVCVCGRTVESISGSNPHDSILWYRVDLGMKSRLDSLANVPKKEYDDEYLDELSLPLTRSANACQKLSAASRHVSNRELYRNPAMIPTNLVKFFDTIETRIDFVYSYIIFIVHCCFGKKEIIIFTREYKDYGILLS